MTQKGNPRARSDKRARTDEAETLKDKDSKDSKDSQQESVSENAAETNRTEVVEEQSASPGAGAETEPSAPADTARAAASDGAVQPEQTPVQPETRSPQANNASRAGVWLGTAALLVALGGNGLTFYLVKRMLERVHSYVTYVSDKVETQKTDLRTVQQQVAAIVEVDAQITALKEQWRQLEAAFIETRERLARDEAALDRLQGIAKSAAEMTEALAKLGDRRWVVEAGEALAFAQRQLAWDGNVNAAQGALATLAARLKEADRPLLRGLREAVEADLLAVQAAPRVDLDGILAKLAALDDAIANAPFAYLAEVDPKHKVADTADASAPWYQRAWATVVAFGRAVGQEWADWLRLERLDATAPELLSPEAATTLQLNITTWIAAARVAAQRGDETAYQTALAKLEKALARYFDPNAPATQAAQAAIAALKAERVHAERPTLARSLKALSEIETRLAAPEMQPIGKE
ncbi:uroporphyrinogen-III C-methyltransferase [Hydrogenophilus thiooxidans]|uniref:uroporphyrinogen-III C-methyltransferase n=1 Tax=Hydrogenophilus thiooxidans TaxID=2820326 RepID=UPI001C23CC88|nr:uroporphyrinogen-III C-methyltransferase [Hydrogenophilus thiooxidans]